MTKVTSISIDTREPSPFQALGFGGVAPVTVTTLPAGDFHFVTSDTIVVLERKTTQDLLHTVMQDRMLRQVAAMREITAHCYVVITGTFVRSPRDTVIAGNRESGFPWVALIGALTSVQEAGAVLVFCDEDEFETTALRIAARPHGAITIPPMRTTKVLTLQESVLASLPGVGTTKADALLAFSGGSVAGALAFLTDFRAPGAVAGIGPGIRGRVRTALGLGEDSVLAVVREGGDHGNEA